MKKKVGICISKCLKSAAKNRRANQTAPTVFNVSLLLLIKYVPIEYVGTVSPDYICLYYLHIPPPPLPQSMHVVCMFYPSPSPLPPPPLTTAVEIFTCIRGGGADYLCWK